VSAEAFSKELPTYLTLADVAAMADADQRGHRFELSPEGVLSVMPPPGVEHAIIASRLFAWLLTHGWPADQVLQNVGVKIDLDQGVGGRVPDLTLWSAPPAGPVWSSVKNLVLAIEIISPGSGSIDRIIKKEEYAAAGIPRYWIVSAEAGNPVTMLRLAGEDYHQLRVQPLSWLLNTTPAVHLAD
jgi:Uma2 family endonuclease